MNRGARSPSGGGISPSGRFWLWGRRTSVLPIRSERLRRILRFVVFFPTRFSVGGRLSSKEPRAHKPTTGCTSQHHDHPDPRRIPRPATHLHPRSRRATRHHCQILDRIPVLINPLNLIPNFHVSEYSHSEKPTYLPVFYQ